MKRLCGINTGTEFHLLDHIAPLSYMLKMPLVVTEEINYAFAQKFYPQIKTIYEPNLEFKLSWLAEEFDVLFECRYWEGHLKKLFETLYNKTMRLVFCPHGQSDKGYKSPILAPYKKQDAILLYGDLMRKMLEELNIWESITTSVVVGNYRAYFYEKYQKFYDEMAQKEIPLKKENKTLIYAPTWNDADKATSFFKYGKNVIETLPSDWNLIVRVHPLLEQRDPSLFYHVSACIEEVPNAFLLGDFPPVYPILALGDAYLGDASSVGYDFLYFQKPMYLFPDDLPSRLSTCAKIIDPTQNIYLEMDKQNKDTRKQNELYQFAFSPCLCEEKMRNTFLKEIQINSHP